MMGSKLVALMLAAALNPLVVRAPEPHGNVPADCEVSDRPAVPRVQIAEAEEVAPLPPVRPTSAPKYDFKALDRAIANNDRAAFDAELARAREAGAPTRKYDDIKRLWDAQFESPFFAQDSEAYRIAGNYPGYEEAMRRHVFTDASGRKFYPAAESRAFVAGRAIPTRTPAPTTTRRASAAPRRTTTRPRLATNRTTSSRKPAAPRESSPPSRSPDPSAAPPPAATDPAPAAPSSTSPVVDTSSTAAPPAAGSLETAAPVPETAAPAPATTTTTAPQTTASKGRPILLPAILILIGLGVLILLFRTKA